MSISSSDKKISGVKIWIDKDFLQTTKGTGELLTLLENYNVSTIIEQLPIRNSIFWTRSPLSGSIDIQHHHALIKIELLTFIDYFNDYYNLTVNNSKFNTFLRDMKTNKILSVTLLINDFKDYYTSLNRNSKKFNGNDPKTNTKLKVKKSDVRNFLIKLELEDKINIRSYQSVEDLKDLVFCYTKSISEYSAKKGSSDDMLFCDKSVEKSVAKVSKNSIGLIGLWKDVIETFPLVSADQAESICSVYPSPFLLKNAFNQSDQTSKSNLLADIQVYLRRCYI
jgi:hypothetical protein